MDKYDCHDDPELQRKLEHEPSYRAFAHCVRAVGRTPEDFFRRGGGLDVPSFRAEVGVMSGGERRLMYAALQLVNGDIDPGEVGLKHVPLDELVCDLGAELNQVLVEALALRRP